MERRDEVRKGRNARSVEDKHFEIWTLGSGDFGLSPSVGILPRDRSLY